MSRSSPEHVRIGLAPGRLAVAAYAAGWRRHWRKGLQRGELIAVAPAPADAPPWKSAVDALCDALGGGPRRRRVTVVLSNHFVRYAVLPWSAALGDAAEWEAYARHRFEAVHGQAAAGWALRIAAPSPRGSRVACAVDGALLEALEAAVAAAGAELVSVQPALMAAFNARRERLAHGTTWLVVHDPGRLTLALLNAGEWRSVRSRRVAEGWLAELPALIERESAALALEARCEEVAIHTCDPVDAAAAGTLRVRDITLPRGLPDSRRPLALALA